MTHPEMTLPEIATPIHSMVLFDDQRKILMKMINDKNYRQLLMTDELLTEFKLMVIHGSTKDPKLRAIAQCLLQINHKDYLLEEKC